MLRLITAVLVLALLSGCATTPQPSSPPHQARSDYLRAHMTWTVAMSLVAVTPHEKFKARVQWQHMPQHYTIKMRDFIGRTVAVVEGKPDLVVAKTSKGQRYQNVDADHLLAELTGLDLPVNGLKYWLLGLVDPHLSHEVYQTGAQGLPQVIKQAGWTIRYQAYENVGPVAMANTIMLDQDDISLRVKISRWQLPISDE